MWLKNKLLVTYQLLGRWHLSPPPPLSFKPVCQWKPDDSCEMEQSLLVLPGKMRLIKSCHLCTKYKEQQQKNKNKLQTDTLRSSFGIEGSFSLDISNAAVKLLTSTSVPTKADSRRVVNGMLVWTLPTWQWHDNALIICLKMHRKLEMLHLCVCTCHFGPHGERWWM